MLSVGPRPHRSPPILTVDLSSSAFARAHEGGFACFGIDARFDEGLRAQEPQDGGKGGIGHAADIVRSNSVRK